VGSCFSGLGSVTFRGGVHMCPQLCGLIARPSPPFGCPSVSIHPHFLAPRDPPSGPPPGPGSDFHCTCLKCSLAPPPTPTVAALRHECGRRSRLNFVHRAGRAAVSTRVQCVFAPPGPAIARARCPGEPFGQRGRSPPAVEGTPDLGRGEGGERADLRRGHLERFSKQVRQGA
jgi:hypothetical protein